MFVIASRLLLHVLVFLLLHFCSAQGATQSFAIATTCNSSVGISYNLVSISKSFPYELNPDEQPYAFKANLEIFNAGEEDLKGWEVFIGYVNKEILVSAGGALLSDGSSFPVNASEGVTLTSSDTLKTGIETANDLSQMGVVLELKGTEFGKNESSLPNNITLVDPNFQCSKPILSIKAGTIQTCCTKVNSSIVLEDTTYLPRYTGDITISYDVLRALTNQYSAQVTISNDNPTGRLDYWNLQWTWQYGEIIYSMKGATTTSQDQNACIFGDAGKYYANVDFSQVTSCQSTPTIIDLDQYKANDSTLGRIDYCCRNGTLLPSIQDASKSKSVFQLLVFKLPPESDNSTLIYPPINWKLNGTFNADYTCGQPRLVEPTVNADSGTAQRSLSSVLTWQVTCNVTSKPSTPPKCCVSFSSYKNASVIPCKACACGCSSLPSKCNASSEALFIPVELATVPTANRTAKTLAWYQLNRWNVPEILPCPDNCGVSVNWHLVSDYSKGWSARMTIFNWKGMQFQDWSAAVELAAVVYPGFQQAYSFNYSNPGNNTVIVYGLSGLNYLNGIYDNYPGIQQSVLSFTLEGVTGNVTSQNFYPTKVFFDGNECALPGIYPASHADKVWRRGFDVFVIFVVLLLHGLSGVS